MPFPLLGLVFVAAAARAASFDFTSLQALLERQDMRTIEELIAALPPAQRSRYTLVFDSRSLQGASFENPRAILFGPEARFIVAFNGSPAQRGFHVVETMEFDDDRKEFRLRELEFPERAAEGKVIVSEVNPERCTRCHGAPPRPVWDSFPLWPGAYGERYRASLSARERTGLAAFLARQPMHPRYRQLLGAKRFADPLTFRPSALSEYAATAAEPPNAELALHLGGLQGQVIARRLEQRPAFGAYQYALLGVAESACGQLADFYPEALWREERPAFERFVRDTAVANARQAQLKAARAASGGAAATSPARADTLLQLRFVAETALGDSAQEWTLALEKGTYDFTFPPAATRALRETLLGEIAAHDPAVRGLSLYSTSADGDRYCSYLKRRSRSALSPTSSAASGSAQPPSGTAPAGPDAAAGGRTMPANVPAAMALERPPALKLCVSCHETGVAPALPFSDPTQLAQALRERPAAHGRLLDEIRFRLAPEAGAQHMPLGLNLSDAERHELETYLAALAGTAN